MKRLVASRASKRRFLNWREISQILLSKKMNWILLVIMVFYLPIKGLFSLAFLQILYFIFVKNNFVDVAVKQGEKMSSWDKKDNLGIKISC
jgi:hypothetical protein